MVESLVDGQSDTAETVDFHDVVAEIVEDVILRQVGHHLIQQHDVLVTHVTPSHVVVVKRHFLVRTRSSALHVDRLRGIVVGEDVVVDDGLQRRRHSIRIRLDL